MHRCRSGHRDDARERRARVTGFPPPPAGPPWDIAFADATFAFVDLEMTGLDLARDRVIEVCIERVSGFRFITTAAASGAIEAGANEGKREALLSTLVNPEIPIGAQHVHGIDEAMVAEAPRFAAISSEIERVLTGAIFVAHAAKYDAEFLNMELARAGSTYRVVHYIDTLQIARRALGLQSHSLDALCTHFGIERGNAHRAEADVDALRTVFSRIVGTVSPTTPRDLWEVRVAARLARTQVISACEAARVSGAPVTVTYRPSGKKQQIFAYIVTEVAADLDPPRVMGYLVSGRSRRELRADRILRVETPT